MGREKSRQKLAIRKAFAPKKKAATQQRQHRFESFSQRISRLKIDPIRRDRGRQDDEDLQELGSHFKSALEKWRDLNLSEDFTRFSRQVDAVCENLPQVIYHQDRIADLLLQEIERGTSVSAEPFLDLIAHLAQDLRASFYDRHLDRTIKTVLSVAARHQEVEVVEWCFGCLTWLFKYLERFLAANICPLYDLLAPYLGKEKQKPHVSRFAAESLSFLVKRVGRKDVDARLFSAHAFEDLLQTSRANDTELYEHSLIALFLETIRSVRGTLHSTGHNVFSAIVGRHLHLCSQTDGCEPVGRVVRGVFVQLLHQCSPDDLVPLLDHVCSSFPEGNPGPHFTEIVPLTQLLLLAVSIKKGHGVRNWRALFDCLSLQIRTLAAFGPDHHKMEAMEILAVFAVAHQHCPLDAALSVVTVFDSLLQPEWQSFFLGFCNLYAAQGGDRFRSFLLPRFQRFLTTFWDRHTKPLYMIVPKLRRDGTIPKDSLKPSDAFATFMLDELKKNAFDAPDSVDDDERICAMVHGLLSLTEALALGPAVTKELDQAVFEAVKLCLENGVRNPARVSIVGHAFMHLSDVGMEQKEIWLRALLPLIAKNAPLLTDLPIFFQASSQFLQVASSLPESSSIHLEKLRNVTLKCVSSSSHGMRLAALETLKWILAAQGAEHLDIMDSCIDVENTEPSIETARLISMKIQKLGTQYKVYASDPILAETVPRWLFGLLHVKLASVWEDVCSALKEIGETKAGEDSICETAFLWLSDAPIRDKPTEVAARQEQDANVEDQFSRIRSGLIESISITDRTDQILVDDFHERHRKVPYLTSFNRTQALKVLKAAPNLAEKKARHLVPVLLSLFRAGAPEDAEVQGSDFEEESVRQDDLCQSNLIWPRKDQKSLLSLFASFNNPKVLYKSEEVYNTLMKLLEHGDEEVQRAALQAILAWKDKTLRRYSEDLMKFLDDARLREQLSVFLDSDGAVEGGLQAEDRATVMPVALRLVYGRIVSRSKNERGSNRRAVMVILAKFSNSEVNMFLDVVLGPAANATNTQNTPPKRQVGMLNMVKDLLETWKTTAEVYISRIVPPVFSNLLSAVDTHDGSTPPSNKAIRQIALQCLNLCFQVGVTLDWTTYISGLFEGVIRPRLLRFAEENAQGVSTLLRTTAIWAQSPSLAMHLHIHDQMLLTQIIDLVGLPFGKEQVQLFVLGEILNPFIGLCHSDSDIKQVVSGTSNHLLAQISTALAKSQSSRLTEELVSTASALAEHVDQCPPALLSVAAAKIQAPTKHVPYHTKVDLLEIIAKFLASCPESSEARIEVFNATCASFAYFGDARSRGLLVKIVEKFADEEEELREVLKTLSGLNANLQTRLNVPDFARRSSAFDIINSSMWTDASIRQWRLLLGNLLFYIKDEDELATRASASQALRRFVDAASTKPEPERDEISRLMQQILGHIERALGNAHELIQTEYLTVMAQMARSLQGWKLVDHLDLLLMGGDEEANFFNNILHVQQHRRIRAMKRLVDVATMGKLSAKHIYQYFLPLLEGFVLKSEDGVLAAEAARTIALLVGWIDWQQFRVLLMRYIKLIKTASEKQEVVLKLIDGVASTIVSSADLKAKRMELAGDTAAADDVAVDKPTQTALSRYMPGPEKISQYVIDEVLAALQLFLKDKDESFVSRRISVALIAAKFTQLLPQQEFQFRFPALLTEVCNILRSKDQGSRDATRRALSSICSMVGPASFGYILRELKTALQRGFYLHVLSYSVHAILEATTKDFQAGDLDYCLADVVDVIIEDVFGNTGKDKDIKDYLADKQTKKEVKGKKSFDIMQLLATITTLGHLGQLIRPVQALLAGTLSSKEVRYVDELLRRIELGVLQNESLKSRDLLTFCYEVVQQAHRLEPGPQKDRKPSSRGLVESAYLDQNFIRRRNISETALHASEAAGKIMRFGLEMVRGVLRKNKDLMTPANVAGFMPLIGDALLSPVEDVKLAAMRLFTGIISVPLKRIDDDAAVYISEAAKVIEDSTNNGGELEQAALKLISAVLRERKSAPVLVKERTISLLLKKMRGELQVISQQGAAFNLLRSIIGRQIIVPELYEIIDGEDGVAAISVRDHDRTTRDLARGVYFQFLMDYPQGKGRFAKQLLFLSRNLEYEHSEGRMSVMTTLQLLISKLGDSLAPELVKELFWPLVAVMVNDADAACRDMASKLIKKFFELASEEWTSSFLALCRKLLSQGNGVQQRTSMQCWAIYFEVAGQDARDIDLMMERIASILEPEVFDAEEWQRSYWALHTLVTIAKGGPDALISGNRSELWSNVRRHLNFAHGWVKSESATLIGMLFKQLESSLSKLDSLPISVRGGLALDISDLCDLTFRHLGLLKEGLTQRLADQVSENLAFLSRVFAGSGAAWYHVNDSAPYADKIVEETGDEFRGFGDSEDEQDETTTNGDRSEAEETAIQHLLTQLGAIVRREPNRSASLGPRNADSLLPKSCALGLLSKLCEELPVATIVAVADTILAPLAHLTSAELTVASHSTPDFKAAHEELVRNATELQDNLRERLGTTAFIEALQKVKNAQRERREERRAKRKLEAVARPDLVAKKRLKRETRLKERRKERNLDHRGKRRGW